MTGKLVLLLLIVLALTAGSMAHATGLSLASPVAASPALTLSPTTALPNQAITVTGSDFGLASGVTISSITMGGVAVSSYKISSGSTVLVDSGGNFVATVVIPMNSATLGAGSVTVVATDSTGISASATLTITKPAVTVSPTSSRVGSTITITGSNFPVDSSRSGADIPGPITVEYQVGTAAAKRLATVDSDTLGGFVVSVDVPQDVPTPSTDNTVRAIIAGTLALATVKHSVPKSVLTVSPASGSAGTDVTLTGTELNSYSPVGSVTLGGRGVYAGPTLYTDQNGGFSLIFTVPEHDAGAQPVVVTVGGSEFLTSFNMASAQVSSTPAPPKFPGRSHNLVHSLEPLEDNLLRVFSFDNDSKQWKFYDPRPEFQEFNSLGKLVEGKAYWIQVGDDQSVSLRYRPREFYAGWNLIPW